MTSAAPLQFLILLVGSWISRRQGQAIEFLRAENRVLRTRLGPRRLRFTLRTLVQRDSELSELLMRAFILRRTALMSEDNNDMVLLGSRHSGSTQHIREFLSRNGQPFTYEDVETDPSVQVLFDGFHIGVNDVPVIVCRSGHILKNPTVESLASQLGLSAEFDPKEVRDVVIVGAGPTACSSPR